MNAVPSEPGVYVLRAPNGAFYFGSTADLRKRWELHRSAIRHGRCHQLLANGCSFNPSRAKFQVLAIVTDWKARLRLEESLILQFQLDPLCCNKRRVLTQSGGKGKSPAGLRRRAARLLDQEAA